MASTGITRNGGVTGPVDETIVINGQTIVILFSSADGEASQGGTPFFQLFGSNLTLSIGGFVTIQGETIEW